MADWEEIKRLAADFQKVQLSSTSQKLSERNCVEIVSWLIEKKIIDLIFTSDGKEYLTPSYLVNEIQNELYASGGRINLADLGKNIGVDYGHVTSHLNEVLRQRKDIQNILGQLIDSTYIRKIAGEINEKLQQQGQINVGELTIAYDLPAEFLQQQVLEKHLGTIIIGKQDKNDGKIFFTEAFIARSKAKLRGAIAGITRPIPIQTIISQINMSEKLFFSIFDQTMYGSLTSKLSGAQYIPTSYARSQNDWATNFYKQNGYLEFDALARIGISDYKTYLKKQFANEDLLFLESSVVSKRILDRIEADLDECISSKSYVDLQNSLPSVFTQKDARLVLDKLLTGLKQQQTVVIEDFVLSKAFVEKMMKDCDEVVMERAKEVVESGRYQQFVTDVQGPQSKSTRDDLDEKQDKREERRKKAAGGKSGGGTQGRETKTKSTKKHNRSKTDDDVVAETRKTLEIINADDIINQIQPVLEEEGLDVLLEPLVEYILPKLNEQGIRIAGDLFQAKVQDQNASRRKTHNELQEKLNDLAAEVRLFAKGVKLMPADAQGQLNKYLLKTVCNDIVGELLNYAAAETLSNVNTDNYNTDQKLKFVNELPDEFKTLAPLVKSLSGSIDDFTNSLEPSLNACSMILKKIDKKKDRTIVLNHKHKLLEQLNVCDDVALVLHLAVLVIFISATQTIVHASGKHVSLILTFLKQYVNDGQFSELMNYYDFVTLMLQNGSESANAREKLNEKMQVIKNIANEFNGDK